MQLEGTGGLAAGFSLRPGGEEDLPAVFWLNQAAFAECWSYESLYSALDSGFDLLLCAHGGELAGYLLSLTVLDEIQIMQIAVAEPFRRQGLASAMTAELIRANPGAHEILLEVRASNRAARALYAELGFAETGIRRQYYSPDAAGRREDAVLMARRLG